VRIEAVRRKGREGKGREEETLAMEER